MRMGIAMTLGCAIVAAPAYAQKRGSGQATSALIECAKQFGAQYDPAKKKSMMQVTEQNVTFMRDAVRDCVARRTGAPPGGLTIPEEWVY